MSSDGFRGASEHDVVPDGAKSFVKALQRSLRAGGARPEAGKGRNELANLYDVEFPKLTERYFKASSWPTAEAMNSVIEDDKDGLLILYKELYYRHIYAKMTPTVDDKFDSFQNYVDLFNLLLSLDSSAPAFELPTSWLWDIVDEFIYQFQTFHLFRNKVGDLTPEEVGMLKEHEHMWSAQTVLQYLHALVRKAGIDLTKKAAEQAGSLVDDSQAGVSSMFKPLGYFSLIGLLRVNALLCDYTSALKCLDPIDLRKNRPLFTGVLSCHVSLYYYMGLSYLMCRRYVDACKVFTYFLTYTQRNKSLIARSSNADLVQKRVDQMLGLLAISYVLSGAAGGGSSGGNERDSSSQQLIDENVFHELRERLDDRLTRMRAHEVAAFEEVFHSSAPKFLTVSAPAYDAGINVHTDAGALQLSQFLSEVKSRAHLHELYSYLKLFTTCSVSKLAAFLQQDEEHTLALLLKLQHKTRTQRWTGGAPSEFEWQQLNEVSFTLQKDVIVITEQRAQRRFGDFFIRQINKFEDATHDCKSLKVQRR